MLQLQLIGNLGADAQVKTYDGKEFLSMNVAHSQQFVDRDGVVHKSVQWVSVATNYFSRNLVQYLVKGTKVFVQGSLSTKIFKGNDGAQHVGLNINADLIQLCGGSDRLKNDEDPLSNDAAF